MYTKQTMTKVYKITVDILETKIMFAISVPSAILRQ